ncbi:MAG: Hpt domain-containing protein [Bryobacteraceae bacterium]|nr:Hpt domain-containing protein [Bryobacteraceae bacterium]MDW8378936.1 Hpt domain-containing protein [Bryobacterales bacterium]
MKTGLPSVLGDNVQVENSLCVLDRSLALERVGGDEDLLREMAQLFLEEYPAQISAIRNAVSQRDAKAIERTAHSLKGSVGNFAASTAYQSALALEIVGRTGKLEEAEQTLKALETALADLLPEMERLVASH